MDDRKSLSIAFLAISDQYATFIFLTKWLPAAILDDRKSLSNFGSPIWAILDHRKSLSIAFLAILDQDTIYFIFFKMAASGSPICAKKEIIFSE